MDLTTFLYENGGRVATVTLMRAEAWATAVDYSRESVR
jgi:hypothetical protein